MESEQNPYEATLVEQTANAEQAEGSYAQLFAKIGKISGTVVGVLSGIFFCISGIMLGLSKQGQSPGGLLQAIVTSILLGLFSFLIITAFARLLLMGLGFIVGLIVDISMRGTGRM